MSVLTGSLHDPYRKTVFITNVPYLHFTGMLPHLLHGVRVMVYSVTLATTDVLPEDGHTVTETCRRFMKF